LAGTKNAKAVHDSELALFLDMLMAERGAAAHTIDAYTRDISDFLAFLAAKKSSAAKASADDVRAYLESLAGKGLAPTSRARKLSAIRQFFRFLLGEGLRADDPTSAIDSPKLGRPLPKILSLSEVETLIETAKLACDTSAEGAPRRRALRLYALLETLYASGLRVSELIALPRNVLAADDRVLTITGKGGRERLVPLNEAARGALAAHLVALEDDEGLAASLWLFRPGVEGVGARRQSRSRPGLAACAAPCLCQPSPGKRGGFAHGPAASGARGHLDHADLYPCDRGALAPAGGAASPAGSGSLNETALVSGLRRRGRRLTGSRHEANYNRISVVFPFVVRMPARENPGFPRGLAKLHAYISRFRKADRGA
jgi:integrase/recombinase XerD